MRFVYRILLVGCIVASIGATGYFFFSYQKTGTADSIEKTIEKEEIQHDTESSVGFSAVGDILMEQGMYDWMGEGYQFKNLFDDVLPYLQADLMFMNQESIIGGKELGVLGTGYTFNAPEEVGEQLHQLGFNMIALANNHSYDMGVIGLDNSISFWEQYNDIVTAGMYHSQEDREMPGVIEKNGITFGLLSYTSFTNNRLEDSYEERIAYFTKQEGRYVTEERKAMVKKEVEALQAVSDVIIVSCHWGQEFTYESNTAQREFAAYLNELGVDVILGHHPHVMQPVEWIENVESGQRTLVAYSLGNFLSADVEVNRASANTGNAYSLSSVLTMNFVKADGEDSVRIEDVTYIPVVNHYEEDYSNFHLYLVRDYQEELAEKHYRNEYTTVPFTKAWMIDEIRSVMEKDGIQVLL